VRSLITGGAGFIGSHLSELLLANGWEVTVLDDVSTGQLENVEHLRSRSDYHLVVDSILSPAVVSEVVHKCDVVFHLAAQTIVEHAQRDPVGTLRANVQGTWELLDAAIRVGAAPDGLDRDQLLGLILTSIEDNKPTCGFARDAFAPGLLPGLGGVAYQLLRAHPHHRLPSILTLEGAAPEH
jgi:NAD(P)-dependent dehydrogenase (short-subunit alcohol dehydrogenase family)